MSAGAALSKVVKFSCTACGRCCRVSNALGGSQRIRVHLNEKEVGAIAQHLNTSTKDFRENYTEPHNDIPSEGPLLTLKTQEGDVGGSGAGHCVLLDSSTNSCTVYPVRPTQCRTYPFWPQIMTGAAEWNAEAETQCEGITLVNPSSKVPSQIADSDNSSLEVLINLVIHQIHDRGRGDWTYDEARQLLWESNDNDATTLLHSLKEFEEEFLSHHGSNLVFANEVLRVVDYWKSTDESADPTAPRSQHRLRRLEFVDSPHVIQSAVRLEPDTMIPLHTFLVLPIHQTIADILHNSLPYVLAAAETSTLKVLVIGAGCCSLPAYITIRYNESTVAHNCVIDAVEPSSDVWYAAETFFGIAQLYEKGLVKHIGTGKRFIRNAEGLYHAVIVDSYGPAMAGDNPVGCTDSYAPAQEQLEMWKETAMLLFTPGIVIINAYGDEAWHDHVRRSMEASKVFAKITPEPDRGGSSSNGNSYFNALLVGTVLPR